MRTYKKASYALCFGTSNLVNSYIIQNIATQDAHGMYHYGMPMCVHIYIRRGLQCCCLD